MPDGTMARNVFLGSHDSDGIQVWRERHHNTDVFASLYHYARPDLDSPCVCPIAFDLDAAGNQALARADAVALCQFIEEKLALSQDSIAIYFSGSKGFHVEVPVEVLEPVPSPHMLPLHKYLATRAIQAGIRSIDIAVYDRRRIWRLPNSVNSKSGLYKVPLTWQELRDMDMPTIEELAKKPCGEDTYAMPAFCRAAADIYRRALATWEKNPILHRTGGRQAGFAEGWRVPPCIKAMEDSVIPDGRRHSSYLCASRYFAYINMHPAEILEHLVKLDARNPIRNSDDLTRIAAWASTHGGFPGCDNPILREHCKPDTCFYMALRNSKRTSI